MLRPPQTARPCVFLPKKISFARVLSVAARFSLVLWGCGGRQRNQPNASGKCRVSVGSDSRRG